MIDDGLENLENGEDVYDEETDTKKSIEEDYEGDEENVETEKATARKVSTQKMTTVEVTTAKIKITTPRVNVTEKVTTINAKNSTDATKTNKSEKVLVPRINIDGTQIAFKPNSTSNETRTTERELEINDIADMIFPNRDNKTTKDFDRAGEHDALFDESGEKGNSGAVDSLKVSISIMIATLLVGLMMSTL